MHVSVRAMLATLARMLPTITLARYGALRHVRLGRLCVTFVLARKPTRAERRKVRMRVASSHELARQREVIASLGMLPSRIVRNSGALNTD